MNILKIEPFNNDKITVTVSGYPHAQPVFDVGMTPEELQIAVDAWAINQSEIDSINAGTASLELIEKHKPKIPFDPEKVISREAQVFPIARLVALSPFSYTINEFVRHQNWPQLKGFVSALIAGGVATTQDYDNFNLILGEQGIDLDTF